MPSKQFAANKHQFPLIDRNGLANAPQRKQMGFLSSKEKLMESRLVDSKVSVPWNKARLVGPNVKTEMSLHVLAYNMKRMIKILGTLQLVEVTSDRPNGFSTVQKKMHNLPLGTGSILMRLHTASVEPGFSSINSRYPKPASKVSAGL
jgi:hypothetical protein